MEDSDLVFYEENGETKSLGYKVNNSLINRMPAMVMTGGGKGSKKGAAPKTYAVPAGLYLLHEKIQSTTKQSQQGGANEVGVIGDDLHERLLALAAPTARGERKKASHKTRKKRRTSKRRTRKR
ncbi:hypothetical protein [uncultured Mediterranean phage]|nr:hypothetical protein [uncultured Mediterranean phage]